MLARPKAQYIKEVSSEGGGRGVALFKFWGHFQDLSGETRGERVVKN